MLLWLTRPGALHLPAVARHAHALEQRQLLTLTCKIVPVVAALAYTSLGAVGDCAVVEQPPGNMQSLLRHAIWIKCFTCWL